MIALKFLLFNFDHSKTGSPFVRVALLQREPVSPSLSKKSAVGRWAEESFTDHLAVPEVLPNGLIFDPERSSADDFDREEILGNPQLSVLPFQKTLVTAVQFGNHRKTPEIKLEIRSFRRAEGYEGIIENVLSEALLDPERLLVSPGMTEFIKLPDSVVLVVQAEEMAGTRFGVQMQFRLYGTGAKLGGGGGGGGDISASKLQLAVYRPETIPNSNSPSPSCSADKHPTRWTEVVRTREFSKAIGNVDAERAVFPSFNLCLTELCGPEATSDAIDHTLLFKILRIGRNPNGEKATANFAFFKASLRQMMDATLDFPNEPLRGVLELPIFKDPDRIQIENIRAQLVYFKMLRFPSFLDFLQCKSAHLRLSLAIDISASTLPEHRPPLPPVDDQVSVFQENLKKGIIQTKQPFVDDPIFLGQSSGDLLAIPINCDQLTLPLPSSSSSSSSSSVPSSAQEIQKIVSYTFAPIEVENTVEKAIESIGLTLRPWLRLPSPTVASEPKIYEEVYAFGAKVKDGVSNFPAIVRDDYFKIKSEESLDSIVDSSAAPPPPLSRDSSSSTQESVQLPLSITETIRAYRGLLIKTSTSGVPSRLAPILRSFIKKVNKKQQAQSHLLDYFVLLIISDGQIFDWRDTIDAIVAASFLPISILIAGVGVHFRGIERVTSLFCGANAVEASKRGEGYHMMASSGRFVQARPVLTFIPFSYATPMVVTVSPSLATVSPTPTTATSPKPAAGVMPVVDLDEATELILSQLPRQALQYWRAAELLPLPSGSRISAELLCHHNDVLPSKVHLQTPIPEPPHQPTSDRESSSVKNCHLCSCSFSLIVHRHLCRRCWKTVCANCSNHLFETKRICDVCAPVFLRKTQTFFDF